MKLEAKGKERWNHKIGAHMYKWIKLKRCAFLSKQVQVDLMRLNPSADKEQMFCKYFTDKMVRSLYIVGGTLVIAILLKVQSYQKSVFDDTPYIERNAYMEEDKQVELIADVGGKEEKVVIAVSAEQYTPEEIQLLYEEFLQSLPELIVGENASLQEVSSSLSLQENYEGYPFWLEWKSYEGDVVSRNGVVQPMEQERKVLLSVDIFYEEQVWSEQVEVTVLPCEKTKEERDNEELTKMLETSEKNSVQDSIWVLPISWLGQDIQWRKQVEDYGGLVFLMGVLVAVLIFFCRDVDLHKEVAERGIQMKQDYPDIVYKIVLYMGAGMTMRGAFRKIAEEYEGQRTTIPRAAYEEILYTVHELESGISESEAYINLGKRTGVQEYIRLGTLLAQNLKRGNATLLLRLHEEVDKASLERMQNAKRCAEEAVTKLLVPMVMMLAIVMIMVMMPAFTSIK